MFVRVCERVCADRVVSVVHSVNEPEFLREDSEGYSLYNE